LTQKLYIIGQQV